MHQDVYWNFITYPENWCLYDVFMIIYIVFEFVSEILFSNKNNYENLHIQIKLQFVMDKILPH